MTEQELERLNPQELVSQAIELKAEADALTARYEDEKKAAFEKHKGITSQVKALVQPLLDSIQLIKDGLAEWRESHTATDLSGCSFRAGKYQVVSFDLALLVKKAAENPALLRYLALDEKVVQGTVNDREEMHGIPGLRVKRGPYVVVLKGGE